MRLRPSSRLRPGASPFFWAVAIALPLLSVKAAAGAGPAKKQGDVDRVTLCVERAEQPSQAMAMAKFQASKSLRLQDEIVRTSRWATSQSMQPADGRLVRSCSFELSKLGKDWIYHPDSIQAVEFAQGASGVPPKTWKPYPGR
jgi:hypothetical protein